VRRFAAECREVDEPRARLGLSFLLYLNAALGAFFGLIRLLAHANPPQFVLGLTIVVLGCLVATGLVASKDRDQLRTVLLIATWFLTQPWLAGRLKLNTAGCRSVRPVVVVKDTSPVHSWTPRRSCR
jgi:hypothetical protein